MRGPFRRCMDCAVDVPIGSDEEWGHLSHQLVLPDELERLHPRQYPLPPLLLVEWRRGNRRQHAVGFLAAESASHLFLCDQFDGKHPNSRRIWTIDIGDVVVREELFRLGALQSAVNDAFNRAVVSEADRLDGELLADNGQEYDGLVNAGGVA